MTGDREHPGAAPEGRRRRWAAALLLALALHSGATWWLYERATTTRLPDAPAEARLAFELVEPPPAPEAKPAPPAPERVRPPPPPAHRPPKATPPSVPAPRVAEALGAEGAASAEAAGPPAGDDEPALFDGEPFPRHAWGEPPKAPAIVDDKPGEPAPPAAVVGLSPRADPVGKKRHVPSLLDRVVGGGPSGEALLGALKTAPPPTSETEAARQRVAAWSGLRSSPSDGLRGRRMLVKTDRGGYQWRIEGTGERPPGAPLPRDTGWSRKFSASGANQGVTFDDSDRPPPPPLGDRDDLVALDDGGFLYEANGWAARIRPDGEVEFDENALSFERGPRTPLGEKLNKKVGLDLFRDSTSGSFDVTDALYRLAGKDPYYAAKSCFLDDVTPIREELRERWQREQLEAAVAALRSHLDDVWADPTHPAPERRAAIFRLWDECTDEEAGAVARRLIVSWVRQRIPASSPDAFTHAELEACNAGRTSSEPFAPYGEEGGSADAGSSSG